MKLKIAIVISALLFIQSCIPSLHPLWTQDKLVFEEKILGEWVQDDSDPDWVISWNFSGGFDGEKNLPSRYELIYKEGESEAKFKIHLVKLGEHLFFDIFPDEVETMKYGDKILAVPISLKGFGSNKADEPDVPLNSLYFQHMLPVHTFAKVEIEKDEVRVFRFDTEWLDNLFQERKVRIKHEELNDGQIVLTASTEELQKFFEKYADDGKAYLDPIILQRKQ